MESETTPVREEPALGPSAGLVAQVADALDENQPDKVSALIRPLGPADLADLIEQLDPDRRAKLIGTLRNAFDPEVLPELSESVRDEVAEEIGIEGLARAIARLESDDALLLISSLEEGKQRQVLRTLPAALRAVVEEGLTYPEESAGRLMQRDLVAVPAFWSVGEVIDFMRETDDLPDDFNDLFVIDPRHRAVGRVALNRLLRTKRPVLIGDIMERDIITVPAETDQEEVAFLFRQHDLLSMPVVDSSQRLLGVITIDDVVDVIEEEAEEDMLRLAGVGETDIHATVRETAPRRVRWLIVTLINTCIASFVISHFEGTISRMVALAVLMPIVAAMGGNAGMQVVAVTVRALATRQLTAANMSRVVSKELIVGGVNGIVFAAIMGTVAALWFHDSRLGLVLAAAMVFNMVWAGFAGTMLPLLIARSGADPAIAAGPFLTTTTDVLGFLSFLGLATLFLL
jgi:magnesium transporter